jgi:hypothetical protein
MKGKRKKETGDFSVKIFEPQMDTDETQIFLSADFADFRRLEQRGKQCGPAEG